jgi:hypothetical protein
MRLAGIRIAVRPRMTNHRTSRCRFALLAVSIIAACSSAPEPDTSGAGASTVTSELSSGVWELEEYPNNCADECGAPNCNCVQNRCSASLDGQACSSVGASCNVVYSNYWREMFCEEPSPPPAPKWTRISTESCADICGVLNCNCVHNRCVGNPEGQSCSTVGATCNVVSGPFFAELTCQ